MISDHARAEDIAQEVFISALRRLRATDQPMMFKPWLYEIAKNACIDEFRRTRRAHEVPLDTGPDAHEVGNLHSMALTPDAAIESKQRLDDLRGAFRGLSDSHHRILVLRELEGLSYNQIGDRLGISKPVVESTLFRARRRLGEEYAELQSGRRCARVQGLVSTVADSGRPVTSLGLRERRLMTRHLSHCESCQRHARVAGVAGLAPRDLGKVAKGGPAVLLPLPWLRSRGRGTSGGEHAASGTGHATAAFQAVQSIVPAASSGTPMSGVTRAMTAAALAIVGAGSGFVASRSIGTNGAGTPLSHHLVAASPFMSGSVGVLGADGVASRVASSGLWTPLGGRSGDLTAAAPVPGTGRIASQSLLTILPSTTGGRSSTSATSLVPVVGAAASASAAGVLRTVVASGRAFGAGGAGVAGGGLGTIAKAGAGALKPGGLPVRGITLQLPTHPIQPVTSAAGTAASLVPGATGGLSSQLGSVGSGLSAAAAGALAGVGSLTSSLPSAPGVVSTTIGAVQGAASPGTGAASGVSAAATGGSTNTGATGATATGQGGTTHHHGLLGAVGKTVTGVMKNGVATAGAAIGATTSAGASTTSTAAGAAGSAGGTAGTTAGAATSTAGTAAGAVGTAGGAAAGAVGTAGSAAAGAAGAVGSALGAAGSAASGASSTVASTVAGALSSAASAGASAANTAGSAAKNS